MTNYGRYSEAQRNDPELRAAVEAELNAEYKILTEASAKLKEAYELLLQATGIEEDSLDQSSGLLEARMNVVSAIRKFDYKIAHKANETFIGNVAVSMNADKAAELKAKYSNGMD